MNTFQTALMWHYKGVGVIPLLRNSKKASVKWAQYQAYKPSEHRIRTWFTNHRGNMGLLCGPVSGGLCVLDFDSVRTYWKWKKAHPELAGTYTVRTPRPGYHVYLICDNLPSKTLSVENLDIKTSGYVTAPPSRINGKKYQVINDCMILKVEHLREALEGFLVQPALTRQEAEYCGCRKDAGVQNPREGQHTTTRLPVLRSSTPAKSIIQEIKNSIGITEILSEYTELQPSDAQGRYWLMSCPMPWHEDRNPSFWADAATGRCSCFASWCRAKSGGRPLDVISLNARLKGLTNSESIGDLARRLGLYTPTGVHSDR